MSETEEKILSNLKKTIPKLSQREKDKLLAFSEGMAFVKNKEVEQEQSRCTTTTTYY